MALNVINGNTMRVDTTNHFVVLAMELAYWKKKHNLDILDIDILTKLGKYDGAKRFVEMEQRDFEATRSTLITHIDEINDLVEKRNIDYGATNNP